MSGFLKCLREGHKTVTAPGYDGQLIAFGTIVVENTSDELDAFRRFTKERENPEKAQIPEEAIDVALGLAANDEDGMKKASFSMDPMLHAETQECLSSFNGGMEDSDAKRNMHQKALTIHEKHQGVDHPRVSSTLNELAIACGKTRGPPARGRISSTGLCTSSWTLVERTMTWWQGLCATWASRTETSVTTGS